MTELEIWTPINRWPYDVSSQGRIKRTGVAPRAVVGHVLKPCLSRGYPIAGLRAGKRRTTIHVHSLVAAAFLGPKPLGYQINHIDGNKQNNHFLNLEYVTAKQNTNHAFRLGLRPIGEAHPAAKLTNLKVREIRAKAAMGFTSWKMAKIYGVNSKTIQQVIKGQKWKHLIA